MIHIIVTVDGTYGTKGFVTDLLEELTPEFDTFYACGPLPMLRALENFYPEKARVSYPLKNEWDAELVHVLHVFVKQQIKLKKIM